MYTRPAECGTAVAVAAAPPVRLPARTRPGSPGAANPSTGRILVRDLAVEREPFELVEFDLLGPPRICPAAVAAAVDQNARHPCRRRRRHLELVKPLVGLQQAVLDGVLGLITHQPSRQRIQAGQLLAHQDAKTLLIRREAVHGFPKREAHQCHILKTPTTIVLLHCCTECPAPDRRRRGTVEQDRALAQGREAGQRLAWREAYTSLSLADQSSSLGEQISSYWQPRPTCSAMRTNAGRPYSAPIVPTSQPVMFGVPPGACSGWRSRFFSREIAAGGWLAKLVGCWTRSHASVPSWACYRAWSRHRSRVTIRRQRPLPHGQLRSAGASVTLTCLRSGCISRVAPC